MTGFFNSTSLTADLRLALTTDNWVLATGNWQLATSLVPLREFWLLKFFTPPLFS
jgi:hypothetical protein